MDDRSSYPPLPFSPRPRLFLTATCRAPPAPPRFEFVIPCRHTEADRALLPPLPPPRFPPSAPSGWLADGRAPQTRAVLLRVLERFGSAAVPAAAAPRLGEAEEKARAAAPQPPPPPPPSRPPPPGRRDSIEPTSPAANRRLPPLELRPAPGGGAS
eukprot:tig00000145_g8817.t1